MTYLGHALVENRNGLIAAAMVTHADGNAERDAALLMLADTQPKISKTELKWASGSEETQNYRFPLF